MEMLLYIFGNWCCILAGCILLYHYFVKSQKGRSGASGAGFGMNSMSDGGNAYGGGGFGQGGFNVDSATPAASDKDIMVSRDLQIMICIGERYCYFMFILLFDYAHEHARVYGFISLNFFCFIYFVIS